jgi:hypothetical protein
MLLSGFVSAQKVTTLFYPDSTASFISQDTHCANKNIPFQFENAIRIALLYYPELSSSTIKFRIKKAKSPLAASPTFWSVFKKATKRKYIVTISNSADAKLSGILLKNLSFNAQVGVIGHELAHVSWYQSKKGIYFFKLVCMHLSKKAIDRFEFDTDKRCIEKGLGFQLLSWSREVREKLDIMQWGGCTHPNGKRERYMNPATILYYMSLFPIYIPE